jgi:tetratricopeptide (TPR) repeat protein
MKPIGSITKYYAFIDSTTRAKIDMIMELSENFVEFMELICREALSNDASDDLVYLGVKFGYMGGHDSLIKQISQIHPDVLWAQPYYILGKILAGYIENKEIILDTVQLSLQTNPAPWIEFDLHMILGNYASASSIGSPLEIESMTNMENLIKENDNLKSLNPMLLRIKGYQYNNEGDVKSAIDFFSQALNLSNEYDDQSLMAELHISLAYQTRHFDTAKAMIHLDEAGRLYRNLGSDPEGWRISHVKAAVHNVRGEFNESIDCLLRSMDDVQTFGIEDVIPGTISHIYFEMGYNEDALEWAKMALDSKHTLPGESFNKYRPYLVLSQALVSHGKLEKAKEYLMEAKDMALKVGRDYSMAGFYYATGIFEKAQGNYEDAKFQFLEALKIYENQPRQNSVNLCIYRLAELDVESYDHGHMVLFDLSESWLAKLEQISRDNDYPGFLGLALLLKVRLCIKQGKLNEAYELLDEVIEISQNTGTRFLGKIIEDKFEDIKIDARLS